MPHLSSTKNLHTALIAEVRCMLATMNRERKDTLRPGGDLTLRQLGMKHAMIKARWMGENLKAATTLPGCKSLTYSICRDSENREGSAFRALVETLSLTHADIAALWVEHNDKPEKGGAKYVAPAKKQPKSDVRGKQSAAAEQMVADALKTLPKEIAAKVRSELARADNKLQRLQELMNGRTA